MGYPGAMTRRERVEALRAAIARRVLVLDGAMGTAIQALQLTADDFGGEALEGCNENLVFTRPQVVAEVHRKYYRAGADIAETNTFGGTPLVLDEYGLGQKAREQNRLAAQIAREVAAGFTDRPRWVAGSIGPTTKSLTVTGGVGYMQLVDHFSEQVRGLYEGGADYFLIETAQDTRNVKAALDAIDRLHAEVDDPLPIAISGTIEPMGTMLAGQSAESLAASVAHRDLLYLGLNCATGPEFMTDHVRALAAFTEAPVACVPNAGLPDEDGNYLETPEMLARVLERFCAAGWINVIGGCCGTTDDHVRALSALAESATPRRPRRNVRAFCSGIDFLEFEQEDRPVLVGERTNVIGSRKFKELIAAGQLEEAGEIAKKQVASGAHVIDVCMANPDRDELADMEAFLAVLIRKVKAPIMIDSTDEKVIARALTYCQGKALINSINLEDGLDRFEKVVPLARRYGAALVVGCIDEEGMAVTRQRKLDVAKRSFAILTNDFGVRPQDIIWDPLVFPCATGDVAYVGSAVETIEGTRLLTETFPDTRTVLGISNVSFGLPPAGREVLNSVFLYHCVKAGLSMAIINAQKLERYPSIPEHERRLAEDLLWNRGADPIAAFAAHFRNLKREPVGDKRQVPLDERLKRYIIEGARDGLVEDLEEKLGEASPLDIINGPLMAGMDEVGRLFNGGQLIVAEVLQSAEAMKAAVRHLEPSMEKSEMASRGRILLATVKGDVHDIGKNLVEIILSNNGFDVVNLGIKVPPEQLVSAVREHNPDIVGLSGLLVKSAHQMVTTAEDMSQAGVSVPMMVGGAALSRNFVDRQIAPAYEGTVVYATDAMNGLDIAKKIVDPAEFEDLKAELKEQRVRAALTAPGPAKVSPTAGRRSRHVSTVTDLPQPPDLERHVIANTPLDEIWRHVNPIMLYGRHLGLKGAVAKRVETASAAELSRSEPGRKALQLRELMSEVKEVCRTEMVVKAVYQFFRARADGNSVVLSDRAGERAAVLDFPRQPGADGLCLSDYLRADSDDDTVALFAVVAGEGIRALAERFKKEGSFLKSHALQALALETAEGYAESLHARLRSMWGFPDDPDLSMTDRFKCRYRGKRFSFGYPACPELEDQAWLFRLLRPEEIGLELTEDFMMDPEASVSAIVFHHPECQYFDASKTYARGGS